MSASPPRDRQFPGLADRLRSRLRALGYWKDGRPEVARFCRDKGYRPQYLYAWLKDRTPTYANLTRLAPDLDVSMAWIMFGTEAPEEATPPPRAGEAAPAVPPADRRQRPGSTPVAGTPPAPVLDFPRFKEVTERLARLEAELGAIFQAFPDFYFWLDADGTILSYQIGRGAPLALSAETLVGWRLDRVFAPATGRVGDLLSQALGTGEVVAAEHRLTLDHTERVYEARYIPLETPRRRDRKLFVVVRDITERKQAEAARQALIEVSRELAGTLDLAQATERVVATVVRLFRVRQSVFCRLDPASGDLVCAATAGEIDPADWLGRALPAGTGLSAQAIAGRQLVWSPDLLSDPRLTLPDWLRQDYETQGPATVIAVPLIARETVLGTLILRDRPGRRFTEVECQLLGAFAVQAALALHNAQLYAEAERRRRVAEIMASLAREINASLELRPVLQRVAEGARELCQSDAAWVALRDPASESVYRDYAGVGFGGRGELCAEPGKGVGGQVLLTGRPFRTDRYAEDPRFTKEYLPRVQAAGIVVEAAVPIRIRDRIEGLLYVGNLSARPFTDADERILLQLAEHAAIAIDNARLYTETERRRRAAERFAELGRLLARSRDPREVAQWIADSVLTLLEARASALYWLEPSGVLVSLANEGEALGQLVDGQYVLPPGAGLAALAMQERRPVMSPNLLEDPRVTLTPDLRARLSLLSWRSAAAVPLTVEDRIIGALALGDREGREFDAEALQLLQTFADHAARALGTVMPPTAPAPLSV